MSARVFDLGERRARGARIAALRGEIAARQAELEQLVDGAPLSPPAPPPPADAALIARATFVAEVEAIAGSIPIPPAPRGRRPRRRRSIAVPPCTTEDDIERARRALKRKGMLLR